MTISTGGRRRSLLEYLFAAAISISALAATTWIDAFGGRPYLLSFGAVVVSAWFGGFGPAVLSSTLALAGVNAYQALVRPAEPTLVLALQAIAFVVVCGLVASFARVRDHSERTVRQQAMLLEAMLGQASVGIALVDPHGRLTRVNPRLAEILGRTRETAEGLSCEGLTHPDDWPSTHELMRSVGNGTRAEFAVDKRYLRADGSAVWVHASVSPLIGEDGRPEGLIEIVEDITHRHLAEGRLRESEARYRSLVDASTAIVWTADMTGAFQPPQESWQASTGQTADQYRGWGWREALHPDDRGRIQLTWHDALTASTPVDTEVRIWNVETDGYRWYSARAVPYPGASGAITEWIGACTDIHERRLAEIQLQESEAGARLALDVAKLGTWSWYPDAGLILADRRCREICGFPIDGDVHFAEALGRIHADDQPRVSASLRAAAEDGQAYAEEFRFVHDDGSHRWVVAHGRAITRHRSDSPMTVVIGSVMDVTERRLAEEALRQADRQKDDFLALLAHELRNPLAPIRTSVQFLKLRGQVDDEGQRLYGVIERQVQHLVRMVDDLLDVSRVLRDKVELRPDVVDIADAIAVAVETSRPLIDAHRQELQVTLPASAAAVLGDQVRLAQVVANLLNNASKYSPRGATIAITAERFDGDVVIRVSDRGSGIPVDLLPRIFEPFVQADHSLERSQGGLGIGLTLVRKIVELHGGVVTARSAGSGQGSEFDIRLPAVSAGAALDGDPPVADASPVVPLRVLVVDDNVDAADTMAMLLEVSGHHVLTAHDGMAAIRQVDVWPPDVIVLDIGLPGMSGYEVAAQLRQRGDACPGLIAVTGYGQESDARRAMQAGFEHHMTKPVDAAELLAVIARCGAMRRARASGFA